jgi:hypothetical protein
MHHHGLIFDSTDTGCLRAVIRNGGLVLQNLTVSQEVALTPAQLQAVQAWVGARIEALSRLEGKEGDWHRPGWPLARCQSVHAHTATHAWHAAGA